MKKHIILLIVILISLFTFCSVASASNVSDINGSTNPSLTSISSNITNNYTSKNTNSTNYKKNELFVKFKYSSETSYKKISQMVNRQIGATVLKEYSEVKGLQLVKIPANMSLKDAIAKYKKNSNVIYAEPNYAYAENSIPDDTYYDYQWGLSQVNVSEAWNITTGSHKVIIAVIDSGIDLNHPDLKANIWINKGEIPGNRIDDDHNGYIDDVYGWNFISGNNNISDDDGHGTHVAGIIAAVGNNSKGVTGVMWSATIMPLKFLDNEGNGYVDDAVSAVRYATKMGASIISCSWGGSEYSQALKDVIDASSALVVCAAGNRGSGANDDISPVYPACFTSKNIISVAATDASDVLASFSDYGLNSVDVAAPGTHICSTLPGSQYGYMQGTSMAVPYVTGLAGLIKSIRPDLSALQIKYTILNNVDYISSLAGKILTGGRINALKALTNIITDSTAPAVSVNLKGGSYYSPLNLTLTSSEPATIYYTLNGSNPTRNSLVYTGPIILKTSQTIKFMAIDRSGTLSYVYTDKYKIYRTVKYSYKAKVSHKKWYKKWYKHWYKRHGKWHYYWTYKWAYKLYYTYETRYGKKYVLT
ncbi:S8 family serine peptidase [Methanobacterium sp. MBAC-LM]|uniref:S8 family serine peptidase n=1 Tax=Methanobacterium sp. MBAC-LM TaxID=3412034 RepID=UPI003C728D32